MRIIGTLKKIIFKKKFVKIFLRQDIFYWYIYLVQFISNLYCRVRYCLLEYTKKFNYAFEKLEFWATILSLVKTTIKWNLKMVSWEPCIRERFWLQIWILHRPADNQNIIFSCKFENCSAICKAPFRLPPDWWSSHPIAARW